MPRLWRRLGVYLAAFLLAPLKCLFVRAHFFSWLVDWQTVCEPDYVQCPNGGLTFRDRNHKCEFTPCEFIPNPPLPPPPPDPKTLPVQKWFGRYEFMVPTLDAQALRRGKAVENAWVQAIVAKRAQPLRSNFSGTIDLYAVSRPLPTESVASEYAAHAQDLHVDALVASQVELFIEDGEDAGDASATTRELAVSTAPWTRWEFFGQFGAVTPTVATLQTALRLLKNKTTAGQAPTTSRFATLVVEAETESDIMLELVGQCDSVVASASKAATETDPSASASVFVFITDFREGAKDAVVGEREDDGLRITPWNMTRRDCDPLVVPSARANATASIALLTNANQVVDGLSHGSGVPRNCSCWTRSLVGEAISSRATTEWMRCE